jgi:hypothetical protein
LSGELGVDWNGWGWDWSADLEESPVKIVQGGELFVEGAGIGGGSYGFGGGIKLDGKECKGLFLHGCDCFEEMGRDCD